MFPTLILFGIGEPNLYPKKLLCNKAMKQKSSQQTLILGYSIDYTYVAVGVCHAAAIAQTTGEDIFRSSYS